MGILTPFIVLIERRLLRPMALMLLAMFTLVSGLAVQAGSQPKHRKTARDLAVAVASPLLPGQRWFSQKSGRRMVEVLIISDASDTDMRPLRAHIEQLGGTVNGQFTTVQALLATVPDKAVAVLDERSDVVSISPNRATRHTASALETTIGSASANVRTATGSTTYTGLDGAGIGIAVLDSGVMAAHKHLSDSDGDSRVVRQVSQVGKGSNIAAHDMAPGSPQRIAYESSLNSNTATVPDAYGHGTHVAALAAGRGSYQTAFDTTGVAPGASIIDVRVLGADGTGTVADVLAGLDWVLYNAKRYNIRIVNLSLSAGSTESWVTDPLARSVRTLSAAGIVVVAAAGNYGRITSLKTFGTIGSPGHDPSVITVGSTHMMGTPNRSDDAVNGFSSRGPTRGASISTGGVRSIDNLIKPDLVAPGNRLYSAAATEVMSAGTTVVPDTKYNALVTANPPLREGLNSYQSYGKTLMMLSGTSVAAPVVSGAVALMLQANPGLTPPMVKAILQYSAQPLPTARWSSRAPAC